MRRMRTLTEAVTAIRAADPETALTRSALRRLVVTGAVPSVRIGQKYLVDLDILDNYLGGQPQQQEIVRNGIRRIEV